MLAVCAGLRRGEILALSWPDIEWERAVLHVRRAVEETSAGITFKEPKSRSGRREVALPSIVMDALQQHRAKQNEYRSKLASDYKAGDLICCVEDGSLWAPSAFTSAYRALLRRRGLSGPNFHALRHAHASQLLREGVDPKVISKRLGHSRASFTMDVYAHLMPGQDSEASARINARYQKAIDAKTHRA